MGGIDCPPMRWLRQHPVALACSLALAACARAAPDDDRWTDAYRLDSDSFTITGSNPYFVLEPGLIVVLGDGATELVVTVLDETREIAGVTTRVVEERETKNGTLIEVSRNYYAMSPRTGSVYYFGEDVDIYANGTVTSHEGSWLAGDLAAVPGLMMPGLPLLGARYYQEDAPGVAMDRAEIVGVEGTLQTPAGVFTSVIKARETTPLEPGTVEYKYYAWGTGLIQDGELTLRSVRRRDK